MVSNERLPRPRIGRFRLIQEWLGIAIFLVAVFTLLQLALPRSEVHGRSMERPLWTVSA